MGELPLPFGRGFQRRLVKSMFTGCPVQGQEIPEMYLIQESKKQAWGLNGARRPGPG